MLNLAWKMMKTLGMYRPIISTIPILSQNETLFWDPHANDHLWSVLDTCTYIHTHTYYKYRNTLINMYNALAVTFIVYQLSVFVGASDLTTTLLINTHTHGARPQKASPPFCLCARNNWPSVDTLAYSAAMTKWSSMWRWNVQCGSSQGHIAPRYCTFVLLLCRLSLLCLQ